LKKHILFYGVSVPDGSAAPHNAFVVYSLCLARAVRLPVRLALCYFVGAPRADRKVGEYLASIQYGTYKTSSKI